MKELGKGKVDKLYSEDRESLQPRGLRLGILGAMGSGKSTIAEGLGARWPNAKIVPEEFADNPFLLDFYEGKEGVSFKSQVWFLLNRVSQLSDGFSQNIGSSFVRIDDPAYENNFAFAETQYQLGRMDDREWGLYQTLFGLLREEEPELKADLYAVLTAPTDALMKRIRQRGRDYEEVDSDYIDMLNENVLKLSERLNRSSEVIVIDTNYYGLEAQEANFSRIESRVEGVYQVGKIDREQIVGPEINSRGGGGFDDHLEFPPGGNPHSRRFRGT